MQVESVETYENQGSSSLYERVSNLEVHMFSYMLQSYDIVTGFASYTPIQFFNFKEA